MPKFQSKRPTQMIRLSSRPMYRMEIRDQSNDQPRTSRDIALRHRALHPLQRPLAFEQTRKPSFGYSIFRCRFSKFIPVFQPLGNFSLEAPINGCVELGPCHIIGKVILPRKPLFGAVVISISVTVSQILHQTSPRIEDMHGRHQGARFLRRPSRRFLSHVGGI